MKRIVMSSTVRRKLHQFTDGGGGGGGGDDRIKLDVSYCVVRLSSPLDQRADVILENSWRVTEVRNESVLKMAEVRKERVLRMVEKRKRKVLRMVKERKKRVLKVMDAREKQKEKKKTMQSAVT